MPRAMSALLPSPGSDDPPAPVCGAPTGRTLLVAVGIGAAVPVDVSVGAGVGVPVEVSVGVGVGVGVPVEVSVGVAVGVAVGALEGVDVGVAVAVLVGVDVGAPVGVVPPLGAEELVVYVVAPAATDTNVDCVYTTGVAPTPVPPGPFQHPTAHSTVPGDVALIPATLSRAPTLPSRVPPNEDVRPLFTVTEMRLARVPSGLNSVTLAEVWWPLGHPSVVDHVGAGVKVRAPLAGSRTRLPGSEPTPAAVAAKLRGCVLAPASAEPAVSRPAPAVRPITAKSASHLTFASRRESRRI